MKKKKNELVQAIVDGLQDKKGRDIVVADLTEIADAVCSHFVICTGGSPQPAESNSRQSPSPSAD